MLDAGASARARAAVSCAGPAPCAEVFLACTSHALSTEDEEVMGLLLGDIQVLLPGARGGPRSRWPPSRTTAPPGAARRPRPSDAWLALTPAARLSQGPPEAPVALIWRAVPQIRTDRRKVRPRGCRPRKTRGAEEGLCATAHAPRVQLASCRALSVRRARRGIPGSFLLSSAPRGNTAAQDRVETSPEQMAAATALADQLTHSTGVRTRTIGWFHSHPHITVLPSHVDVHTQAMYQLLEPGFVGLIFSVFNRDAATKAHSVSATAFQSLPAGAGGGDGLEGMGSGELAAFDSETRDAIRAAAVAGGGLGGVWELAGRVWGLLRGGRGRVPALPVHPETNARARTGAAKTTQSRWPRAWAAGPTRGRGRRCPCPSPPAARPPAPASAITRRCRRCCCERSRRHTRHGARRAAAAGAWAEGPGTRSSGGGAGDGPDHQAGKECRPARLQRSAHPLWHSLTGPSHRPRSTPLNRSTSGRKDSAATLLARVHDAGVHAASLCQLAEGSIAPALAALRGLAAQVELQRRQLAEEERALAARVTELEAAAGVGLAEALTLLDV